MQRSTYDVAIVGAGVFGAWSAYLLTQSGARVVLIDSYGPANSRASSGGESRIIRMGYGPDKIYTQSAIESLALWQEFFNRIEAGSTPDAQKLFRKTGVLWLAHAADSYCEATLKNLQQCRVNIELLQRSELEQRYPQFDFGDVRWGILELGSGALMARRAVQAVVTQAQANGATVLIDTVLPSEGRDRATELVTVQGEHIVAEKFIFACGPWLPKLFPKLLHEIIHVSRQEVFFIGPLSGDNRFSPEHMPIWVDFHDLVYAFPNLENRGFKIAIDAHGPEFDPDNGDRVVTETGRQQIRDYLRKRIPALAEAPVIETRICQYENTWNGDFLIDQHPDYQNVWLVGGGSGHGFKHGPAVGSYVVALISGKAEVQARFLLAGKNRSEQRQIF